MTDEDLNKRIYELMGLCWHEGSMRCKKCGAYIDNIDSSNIDFCRTWEGFGILWEWWQQQPEWESAKFICTYFLLYNQRWYLDLTKISPLELAEATVKLFGHGDF